MSVQNIEVKATAEKYRVPRTTLRRKLKAAAMEEAVDKTTASRPPDLTREDARRVAESAPLVRILHYNFGSYNGVCGPRASFIFRRSQTGYHHDNTHDVCCQQFSFTKGTSLVERQEKLQMKDGPGRGFLVEVVIVRNFIKRNPEIKLGRASRNEEIRFRACNADSLATHICAIEELIRKHSMIANLDEAGCTPGKDIRGRTNLVFLMNKKVLTRSKMRQENREPAFLNCSRVTTSHLIVL